MTRLRVLLSRVRGTLGRVHDDSRFDDEVQAHLELLTAEYLRQGLSLDDARAAARRRFGGVAQLKDEYRDQRGVSWLENLGRDVRHAFRALRNAPGFAIVAVLTLALGIGANTAIFTVVNSVLLRPLPVTEPERLVVLAAGESVARELRTWPNGIWEQIQLHSGFFDGVAASSMSQSMSLSSAEGQSETVDGVFVSGDFFKTLGVSPLVGRALTREDDVPGGGRAGLAAVISQALWQRRFAGAPDIVGAPIVIDRVPFTLVGVMPSEFLGLEVGRTFDVAMPIAAEPVLYGRDSMTANGWYWLRIVLRLGTDQSTSAATALLRSVQPQIASAGLSAAPEAARDDFMKQPLVAVPAPAGVSNLRYQYQQPLLAVLVLAGLVLVIACANIANLLLTRGVHRERELQVRLALGAPRGRIARQLLTESVVLATCGAIAGLLLALWGSQVLLSQMSTPMTRVALDLSLDWRIVAFTVAAALTAAAIFGTAPAFRGIRLPPIEALRHAPAERPVRGARMVLPKSLVAGQVALSVVLVIAAGLFIRTLVSLSSHQLGFDAGRLLVVTVGAQRTGVDPDARLALFEQAREAVRAVPGVAAASISMITPLSGSGFFGPEIRVSGPGAPAHTAASARTYANIVSPGWFAAMGTPLVAGRDFTDDDRRGTRPVAIVNQAWARMFVNGASPLGHTIAVVYPYAAAPMEVVGLVADAAYVSLRDPAPPTMYMPFAQFESGPGSMGSTNLVVRSASGPPALLTRGITASLARVNPNIALQFRPLADHVDAVLLQERFVARLSSAFGVLALVLAALGIYGVTAYGTTRRGREIGIRMALGAPRRQVLALVWRQSIAVTGLGLVLGIAGAAAVTRYLESMLFGVRPLDPAVFLSVSLLFAVVAAVASYFPARHATRVDPLVTLRSE